MNTKDFESLSSMLKQSGNFNSGILFLTKTICITNDWPYGEIWHPDKKDKYMIWSGSWSRNEEYFEEFSKFSLLHKFARGVGLIGKTWEQKKLVWMEDFSKDNEFLRSDIAQVKGLNTAVGIPILNNGKVICLLCFFLNKLSLSDKEDAELLFKNSEIIGEILVNLN
jgi:hypothetical protein